MSRLTGIAAHRKLNILVSLFDFLHDPAVCEYISECSRSTKQQLMAISCLDILSFI